LITGPQGWHSVSERLRGYTYEHEAAGMVVDLDHVENGDWSYESGYAAASALIQRCPHLTAIFAQNDQMAIGAISALRRLGRGVPDDIAVVGYDNIPVSKYSNPSLTTIHQPMQEVGQTAARLLIDALSNRSPGHQQLLLKPELVVRESSGKE
jgi:LacI family transcriptional regulator